MTDQPTTTESEETAPAERRSGRLAWLVRPPRRGVLLPLTGAWILALDWILFSSNALSAGLATPIVAVLGLFLGGGGTLFFQTRYAGDPWWKAAFKSVLAGLIVGAPWPLGGTVVGGWVLLFSGLGDAKKEILRR